MMCVGTRLPFALYQLTYINNTVLARFHLRPLLFGMWITGEKELFIRPEEAERKRMIKHKNGQIIKSEPTQTHANYIIHMLLRSMFNHFSLSTMDFEANRTCENRHTHRPKTVWRGEMNQKEFGWIRFMEASYPVVRFATYPIDGSVYLVDHRLENSVPELLLISMPLRRKKNSIVAKRTLSIQIPDGTTGQKGF